MLLVYGLTWVSVDKTPISLGFTEVNKCTKVLVITINSKAQEKITDSGSWLNWANQSEIKYDFRDKKCKEFDVNKPELLLVNYESLFERGDNKKEKVTLKENIKEFIKSCYKHNVAIVVDESHKMKNLQSQQTGAIIKIKDALKRIANKTYCYLLTGTPFTTGYIDLYAQLKFLGADINKNQFIDMFCERGRIRGLLEWQQPIVGYKNLPSLFNLIHQYAITIKSEEVLNNLPEKTFVEHITPMSKEFIAFISEKLKPSEILSIYNKHGIKADKDYLSIKEKRINNPFYRNIANPDEKWLAETSGAFWLRARQLSIGFQGNAEDAIWYDRSRLNQLEKFLKDNEDNYLLFYNYTPELLEIYDICEKLDYKIDVYSGEVKSLEFYNKFCNLSESDKLVTKKNIILANFSSGSTGMNWQQYNKCIIFSSPIYSEYEQGIKRIHRLGQKNDCIYHIFYQNNWLDAGMNKALNEKIEYSTNMFSSDLLRVQNLMKEGDK